MASSLKLYAVVSTATDPLWDEDDKLPEIESSHYCLECAEMAAIKLRDDESLHEGTIVTVMRVKLEELEVNGLSNKD